MRCRTPGRSLLAASIATLLALPGAARAAQPLRFVDPTPRPGTVAATPTTAVRIDAACTVDAATLAVEIDGAPLDATAFLPFGPCSDGRKQSQTVDVPLSLPESQIGTGPKRLQIGDPAIFTGTGTGDKLRWNFDGAAQPRSGAQVETGFYAAGTFRVRLRATRRQLLRASASDSIAGAVDAKRRFHAGDATPAKRKLIVEAPPDLDYVNYESAHVHPIALDPSGNRLYAVNTPDARLAAFDVMSDGSLAFAGDVPVGLEPVSLAVRPGSDEVWVVNHLSDSVSVVDVAALALVATIPVGDEPTDVAFASGRAFVAISGARDGVAVVDPATRAVAATVDLFGDDPRALATNASGSEVYAIVLESGNRTTTVFDRIVEAAGGPPPPSPPRAPSLGPAPDTGLIVQLDTADGTWRDDAGNDWSDFVDYTLPDHDVFVIDAAAATPAVVRTVSGVGTILYDVAVHPSGELWVANTDARNVVRFEPNLRGHLVDTRITVVDADAGTVSGRIDLNPHVDFGATPGSADERAMSLSQPGDGVFDAAGQRYYLTAFGSRAVAVLDGSGAILDRIRVGGGPSGVALAESAERLYVLDRFDNGISVVDTAARAEVARIGIGGPSGFDPSPDVVKRGRRFLYDARFSGHGDAACATCHVFGNFDDIAWDLGDPTGDFVPYSETPWTSFFLLGSSKTGFDPQKGPMTTQTLRGLSGSQPFHWRGDRRDFEHFNQTFVGLLGMDGRCSASRTPCASTAECPAQELCEGLSAADMGRFAAFIDTVRFPPNPYRNADDTMPASMPVPAYDGSPSSGNPNRGLSLFVSEPLDAGVFTCNDCHSLPTGTSNQLFNGALELESQDFKIPHLRNMYEKAGFAVFRPGGQTGGPANIAAPEQKKGYGVIHDGAVSLREFLAATIFQMTPQDENDMFAFMLAFPTDSAGCVGRQVTVTAATKGNGALASAIGVLRAQAMDRRCDLIAKGMVGGAARGWALDNDFGNFRPDRDGEPPIAEADLRASLAGGDVLTYTAVPPGSGIRLGIDRDRDRFPDGSEIAAGTDPADPHSNGWAWVP